MMTLRDSEAIDMKVKALSQAERMAAFTIDRIYQEYGDCESGLNGDDIDRVRDSMQILSMVKERRAGAQ